MYSNSYAIIMTSLLSRLVEWFKIKNTEYLTGETFVAENFGQQHNTSSLFPNENFARYYSRVTLFLLNFYFFIL